MDKLKELQKKRAELAKEIRALMDRQADWKAEDRQKWDELNTAYDANMKELTAERTRVETELAEQASIAERMAEIDGYQDINPVAGHIGRDNGRLSGEGVGAPDPRAQAGGLAFQAFLRGGVRNQAEHDACQTLNYNPAGIGFELALHETEPAHMIQDVFRGSHEALRKDRLAQMLHGPAFQNLMSAITGTSGAFTIPEGFVNRIEIAMQEFGPMLRVAETIRTPTGEELPWPTVDDTSNTGQQIGETTDMGGSTDPTVAAFILRSYDFEAKMIQVHRNLLTDSPFNWEQLIGAMLGTRLGKILNTKFTTGTGAATPEGITIGATLGVTAGSTSAITWDELMELEHSLIEPLRPGASYMCADSVVLYLRQLKDGEGRPIWQSGWNAGTPDTLNARPFITNPDMAARGTGNITLMFGDFSHYKVRMVNSIYLMRLDERYAELNKVAFDAIIRADGGLLDAGDNPVQYLQQA